MKIKKCLKADESGKKLLPKIKITFAYIPTLLSWIESMAAKL